MLKHCTGNQMEAISLGMVLEGLNSILRLSSHSLYHFIITQPR